MFCVGSLPFLTDVNTAMGIITKTYLEQTISLSKLNDGKVTHANTSEALRKIQSIFTACTDVKADLINGFAFWDEVRSLASQTLSGAVRLRWRKCNSVDCLIS